jgi:glutathione synthase
MDPIESITPRKDSTLAMLLEAQTRGWKILYGGLEDISLRDGEAFGQLVDLQVADEPENWHQLGSKATTPLGDMDVILMRKDPPFDMEYIVATYVLQRAEERGALVVNRPQALRDANEKAFLTWFPDCAPPTLISRSLEQMQAFIAEYGQVVVKPHHLMGGQSVFVTGATDGNHNVILETVSDYGARYTMLQEYQPEIAKSGDKRIFLVDGEPVPLALARIPAKSDHRGNISSGARTEVRELSDRDRWICERLGPSLRDRGLLFVGIDVIGDFLTEINVTSATGIREIEHASEFHIAKGLFDAISSKLR